MSVEHVKSTPVTNLDATPQVQNTAGEGGPAHLNQVDGYLTVPAAASVGSTLRFARVPSNSKIKTLTFEGEAQGAGKIDIGVFYPSSVAHPDLVANAIDADYFATALDLAAAVTPTDVTNESGTYTVDKRTLPLWQAVGLASDPGGYFDIAGSVITTAVTTGTGKAYLRVTFVN